MISSYGLRLALLACTCFFAVHASAGLLLRLAAPEMVRRARRLSSRSAASLLFCSRLAPAALAFAVVVGLCVPSFLLHEQRTTAEGVGAVCLIGALLGVASSAEGLIRGIRAVLTSSRAIPDADRAHGLVALAGILRPRLLISHDVRAALTAEQLQAALAHEQAHRISRDNFKQLLILLTPSILPGWRGLDSLDRAWKHFTEFAADDYAVAGDPQRSVDLAAALVRVSRLSASPRPVLAASLLDSCGHLELRVSRLLNPAALAQEPRSRLPLLVSAAGLLTLALPLLHPAGLLAVHDLLEKLIH
jgi:hypothetical protein